ncbi:hypothetical protein [Spiroplasma chinense]|nr:hypothetical protein [Spiroplasma chinense]
MVPTINEINNNLKVDKNIARYGTTSIYISKSHPYYVGYWGKGVVRRNTDHEALNLNINLKGGLTNAQLYSSLITFVFASWGWNLSSEAKGLVSPATHTVTVSYADWYFGTSKYSIGTMLRFDLPRLIQKETNYISMIQQNYFKLDTKENILHATISSIVETYVKSYNSGNNRGTAYYGLSKIDFKYII